MLEKFKQKYKFDTEGNVYSLYSTGRYPKLLEEPKLMKSQVDIHGYIRYTLKDNNKKQYTVFKHHIVLYANGKFPSINQTQVNHKNGNKEDNSLSNLEWCTSKENQIHKFDVLGNISTRRKFTEHEIILIRTEYKEGVKGAGITSLANKYGVSYSTMRDILQQTTYKNKEPL